MGVNLGGFIDGIANLDGTIFDELKDKVTDVVDDVIKVDDVINSPEALNAITMVGVASMIPMIFENIENVRRDLEEKPSCGKAEGDFNFVSHPNQPCPKYKKIGSKREFLYETNTVMP